MSKGKIVVLLSGGLDSSTLAYVLDKSEYEIFPLVCMYGQRHSKELFSARLICDELSVPLQVADLTGLANVLGGSALTDSEIDVPLGHYEDPSMKTTVVPNRNMILLSVAAAYAIRTGAKFIAYGAHIGDHAVYPDCRPEFSASMGLALANCHYEPIELLAPFIDAKQSKADIVALGNLLGVPFELTWSCYNGREEHCGNCGTCVERIEAFKLAGILDPTDYEEER